MPDIDLPATIETTALVLSDLTKALRLPRNIIASDDEISHAWSELPRQLNRIPPEFRNELLARMCVAVASGLFDSAINYVWNASIMALRDKVRAFGLNVVPQVTGNSFDEATLRDLKDSELLQLCLSLNLVDEDGYFFLDQCRDVRNNFSAAHPPVANIDDDEFLSFLSRCTKYALASTPNLHGVDTQAFLQAIKGLKFTEEQKTTWVERLRLTHDAQREILVGTLHGIYCDPASSEEARLNALNICEALAPDFTPKIRSGLLNRHSDYIAQGKTDRQTVSQLFLQNLGLLNILSDSERYLIISQASKKLLSVHHSFDNFYNEPPFAERLYELSVQGAIPETAQAEYVEAVTTCAIGNGYGVSNAAYPFYRRMVANFSPREISLFLTLANDPSSIVARRIDMNTDCKQHFKELVNLIDEKSVPTQYLVMYKKWA